MQLLCKSFDARTLRTSSQLPRTTMSDGIQQFGLICFRPRLFLTTGKSFYPTFARSCCFFFLELDSKPRRLLDFQGSWRQSRDKDTSHPSVCIIEGLLGLNDGVSVWIMVSPSTYFSSESPRCYDNVWDICMVIDMSLAVNEARILELVSSPPDCLPGLL